MMARQKQTARKSLKLVAQTSAAYHEIQTLPAAAKEDSVGKYPQVEASASNDPFQDVENSVNAMKHAYQAMKAELGKKTTQLGKKSTELAAERAKTGRLERALAREKGTNAEGKEAMRKLEEIKNMWASLTTIMGGSERVDASGSTNVGSAARKLADTEGIEVQEDNTDGSSRTGIPQLQDEMTPIDPLSIYEPLYLQDQILGFEDLDKDHKEVKDPHLGTRAGSELDDRMLEDFKDELNRLSAD